MQPDNLDFQTWTHLEEIKLRGTYLSMAADADWILAMVLTKCFKGNQAEVEAIYSKPFHKFTMFEKIEATKLGLQKYHSEFYTDHEQNLLSIDKLRDFRNKLAHGKIDWNATANDKTTIYISEMKRTGIVKNSYDLKETWSDLLTFRSTVEGLLNLILKFLSDHPQSS